MRCPAYALIDRPRPPRTAVPVTDVAADGGAAAAAEHHHRHSVRTVSIFRQLPDPPARDAAARVDPRVDRDVAAECDAAAAVDGGGAGGVVVVGAVLGSTVRGADFAPFRDRGMPAGGRRRFG